MVSCAGAANVCHDIPYICTEWQTQGRLNGIFEIESIVKSVSALKYNRKYKTANANDEILSNVNGKYY